MLGLRAKRVNQQAGKKPYSSPEVIKYDTLKELTLCTCRHPFYCDCDTGMWPDGTPCGCTYKTGTHAT